MKIIIKIFLIPTASFYLFMGSLMLYLSSKIDDLAKDKEFITAGDDNICIFTAHQDDGVIMAGGYAVQTIKNGGSVNIVYIFDGETEMEEKGIS